MAIMAITTSNSIKVNPRVAVGVSVLRGMVVGLSFIGILQVALLNILVGLEEVADYIDHLVDFSCAGRVYLASR